MSDFEERVSYRKAFSVAYSIVGSRRHGGPPFDPKNARHVAAIRGRTIAALRHHADSIPHEQIDQAVDDAIHRRPPRW